MMETHENIPLVPLQDEGYQCPTCAYNLTGLTEERCPECGSVFSRVVLAARRRTLHRPIPGWDDGTLVFPLNFVRTCAMTWFLPTSFARSFPPIYRSRPAYRFRVITLLCALIIFGVQCLLRTDGWRLFAASLPGILTGVFLCEAMIGAMFAATRDRAYFRTSKAECSPRGLVGFFRSYLLLSAAIIGFALRSSSPPFFGRASPLTLAISVSALLWWLGLSLAVCGTQRGANEKIAIIMVIPVMAVCAATIGFVVSCVSTLVVMLACR